MVIFKRIFSQYRSAYSGLPREAWMLSLVEFVNRSGTMVFFYMTLYLTQNFTYTLTQAGQVISGYGIGALVGSYAGGKLTDIIGAYNVQKLSLIITGFTFILLGQLTSYWLIMAVMFFMGICSEALQPANATAMSQVCSPELRTKGFALHRLAINLGVTIGPVVGGYLALIDYGLLFWIDGITCLLAAGIFMIFFKTARPVQESHVNSEVSTSSQSVWRDFYFLKVLAFTFFLGVIFVQLFNTFPLFFRTVYGLKENRIGLLIAVNTVMIVLFEMLLMDALKKQPVGKVIGFGALLLGGGFALMPLGSTFLFGCFTVAVWTMGEMLSIPSLAALIANHSNDAVRGKYMGLFSFAFALSMVVGPLLGAKIYDTFGASTLWFGCGAVGFILWWGVTSIENKRIKMIASADKISLPN
ncbi:MAG TPA: MFS transporter [Candidatus Kapabacteria bacterium]|nr:MFS transporter [Candidatus Kapabacteria bacterium]